MSYQELLHVPHPTRTPTENRTIDHQTALSFGQWYLRSWGLSPQKPIRRAYEQNHEAVARWLEVEYPAIEAKARKNTAVILWLDQTGLRSDAPVGTTWAPVGQTPVVGKTGKRFGVNVIAAISNKGELYFTCFTGSFTGPVFLAFLDRLVRHLDRKIHLIVNGRARLAGVLQAQYQVTDCCVDRWPAPDLRAPQALFVVATRIDRPWRWRLGEV
ncbi:transposase [Micromonospora sicca]|uniref:transposase n=1 Tax=Micromonospora sicca TaxID=2202420 RepID=UPI001F31EC80|nr:transposase [Micromonospora sp. 4G51]